VPNARLLNCVNLQSETDYIFGDMSKELGRPPLMFVDLRPVTYPMVVVSNHEVAEQIARVSKLFPWSTPKSPTLSGLMHLTGEHSILTREVRFLT
jgi:hypothetical protein